MKAHKTTFSLVLLLYVLMFPMLAESQNIDRTKLILLMRRQHIKQLSQTERSSPVHPVDVGNIAVINSDLKNLISKNPFDLGGRKITFIPKSAGGYRIKTSTGSICADQGTGTVRGRKEIGFTFPFYGTPYRTIDVS